MRGHTTTLVCMTLEELSPNAQDYLKMIWGLHDWGQIAVQPSALAKKAGVKPSTVTGAVARLVSGGFAEHDPYGAITLTAKGRRYAVAMVRRHRLLETFLMSTLNYGWDEVHQEADALEHAASDMMIDRIDDLLGHPQTDPHGDPIPQSDGSIPRVSSIPLSDAPDHALVRIERVSDTDSALLKYLKDNGLGIGATLRVQRREPFSASTTVTLQPDPNDTGQRTPAPAASITLSDKAAASIRVTKSNVRR